MTFISLLQQFAQKTKKLFSLIKDCVERKRHHYTTYYVSFEGFPRLKKLEKLDLSENYLNSSILPSLNGLTALTTLKLDSNLLENFSVRFCFLYNFFMEYM